MSGWRKVFLFIIALYGQSLTVQNGKINISLQERIVKRNDKSRRSERENPTSLVPNFLKKHEQSEKRCGNDRSYYFEPLNECYRIYSAPFLNLDPDRKIAYGGTRSEYMSNCQQNYGGKLLDIGAKHIAEKMQLVKWLVTDFNRQTYKRQAVQVGFMINQKRELISSNGEHYEKLENVVVENPESGGSCSGVCCVVFLAENLTDVKLVHTSCDNRTRTLSYICEATAISDE